jgi:hypothetical protein
VRKVQMQGIAPRFSCFSSNALAMAILFSHSPQQLTPSGALVCVFFARNVADPQHKMCWEMAAPVQMAVASCCASCTHARWNR